MRFWFHFSRGFSIGVLSGNASTSDDPVDTPKAVQQLWLSGLDGKHFTAHIVVELPHEGKNEERKVTFWRDDARRRQRLMARFEESYDLRGVGLLCVENLDRPPDYFIYQPVTGRVRRIAETLAREHIYGIDLEFLGFGVTQREPVDLESVGYDVLGGRKVFHLIQRARSPNLRFEREAIWIDPSTYLFLKTIHYRHGEIVLQAHPEEVKLIQAVSSFEREGNKETAVLGLEQIDYEAAIPEAYFSTLALVQRR